MVSNDADEVGGDISPWPVSRQRSYGAWRPR